VSSSVLLDSALINLKPDSQFVDGHTVCVALDQLIHLDRLKAAADSPWGSSLGLF
jgi:hypothetical protein